jgi:hypothetical protein
MDMDQNSFHRMYGALKGAKALLQSSSFSTPRNHSHTPHLMRHPHQRRGHSEDSQPDFDP